MTRTVAGTLQTSRSTSFASNAPAAGRIGCRWGGPRRYEFFCLGNVATNISASNAASFTDAALGPVVGYRKLRTALQNAHFGERILEETDFT